ncbi:MAG: SCO family protein [Magnetococcales bacterium]|nr:SCO family protein [Magnetococcales bacterium]
MGTGRITWLMAMVIWGMLLQGAWAFSKPTEHSDIDPNLFRIDEQKYMGVKFGNEVMLLDENGKPFEFANLPNLPFVLVPAYYTCDGACFNVGVALKELLKDVKSMSAGKGFNVVFVSFDKNDTTESLSKFVKQLDIPGDPVTGWRFTRYEKPEVITQEMGKIGYKFFWSPRDRTFFHPTLVMILTPEGRVARYLNVLNVTPKDIELALLEAKSNQFKPSETLDYLVSLCYSYNFKEGRYTLSIPVFVGLGSFLLGIGLLVGSLGIYRLIYHRKNIGK